MWCQIQIIGQLDAHIDVQLLQHSSWKQLCFLTESPSSITRCPGISRSLFCSIHVYHWPILICHWSITIILIIYHLSIIVDLFITGLSLSSISISPIYLCLFLSLFPVYSYMSLIYPSLFMISINFLCLCLSWITDLSSSHLSIYASISVYLSLISLSLSISSVISLCIHSCIYYWSIVYRYLVAIHPPTWLDTGTTHSWLLCLEIKPCSSSPCLFQNDFSYSSSLHIFKWTSDYSTTEKPEGILNCFKSDINLGRIEIFKILSLSIHAFLVFCKQVLDILSQTHHKVFCILTATNDISNFN